MLLYTKNDVCVYIHKTYLKTLYFTNSLGARWRYNFGQIHFSCNSLFWYQSSCDWKHVPEYILCTRSRRTLYKLFVLIWPSCLKWCVMSARDIIEKIPSGLSLFHSPSPTSWLVLTSQNASEMKAQWGELSFYKGKKAEKQWPTGSCIASRSKCMIFSRKLGKHWELKCVLRIPRYFPVVFSILLRWAALFINGAFFCVIDKVKPFRSYSLVNI